MTHALVLAVSSLRGRLRRDHPLMGMDAMLMAFTGVLAGCGLIYEYMLAHYAARVMGAVETVIYTIISLMIVSMGAGSFLSARIRDPYRGFVILELGLATLGSLAVLMSGLLMAGAYILPATVSTTLGLPDHLFRGGMFADLRTVVGWLPYVIACGLGVLIGMEIPLIARIREMQHARHLRNNIGTIYGADYIGAGLGAVLWVGWMLALDPARSAALTALANLTIGLLFLLSFRREVKGFPIFMGLHLIAFAGVALIALKGPSWETMAEDVLYADRVVMSHDTRYQHLVVTRRENGPGGAPVLTFHINGRVQFTSTDEAIYHSMLVTPAMMAAARHDKVLIVGGGDGLALRDVLTWDPESVTLLDLDADLVKFFTYPTADGLNGPFLAMNKASFLDPRVETRFGDAWMSADDLIQEGQRFDVIIVDLPDPSHPDLNKLYSTGFYGKLRQLLTGDGAMVVQSTSPYHARRTFLSIGKTVEASGFQSVQQYHANVPSFGEWGWTIAVPHGAPPRRRIEAFLDSGAPWPSTWATPDVLRGAFAFGRGFRDGLDRIEINRPRSTTLYRYHMEDWATAVPRS